MLFSSITRRLLEATRTLPIAGLLALAFSAAYALSMALRFEFQTPPAMASVLVRTLPVVVVAQLVFFVAARQHRAWWRHVSFVDLMCLFYAASGSLLFLFAANNLRLLPGFIPRSVLVMDSVLALAFACALRSSWRAFEELALPYLKRQRPRRAILAGASPYDKVLALQLHSRQTHSFKICGYLDETSRLRGRSIGGVPILGSVDDLASCVRAANVTDVLAIVGGLPGRRLRELRRQCEELRLAFHLLPPLSQLTEGQAELPTKPIRMESLLRRASVRLDEASIQGLAKGAVVVVTGAGGSIGSELCRQLVRFGAKKLILVDRSEPSLYQIDLELRRNSYECDIHPFLGDVADEPRMNRLFQEHRPQIVFHVAAHKHVPMLEYHPGEAIKNNVFGTARLADAAESHGVERFIYISTDKAVNPTSVMGTSKRLAENYVLSMDASSSTRFVAVRFGNVLGSAGSVVPLFQDQIRQGGPITVTHPEMQRFFMTIPEASRLVLQAAALGDGGEIFVLDMGDPVRIVDLANDMVRLSGLPPQAVDVSFVGLRPGEKLYEELYFDDEERLATPHPKLFSARHRPIDREAMRRCLEELRPMVDGPSKDLLLKLTEWVPEYAPSHIADDGVAASVGASSDNFAIANSAPHKPR